MKAMIGKKAPHIDATAVVNGNQIVEHFSLDQYVGNKYVVLFFYPLDFTFVCPTELHAFQEKLAEFDKNKGGIHGVTFPIISDLSKTISENYGVLASDYDYDDDGNAISTGTAVAYRGLFLIDKEGNIRHYVINDLPLGRNVDEVLRMVDALQHFEEFGEVCPANWSKGKDAMEASGKGVADYLSKH